MSKINTTYKKIMKDLRGKINFDSIVSYLQTLGYTVIYYSSTECLALLQKYDLIEKVAEVNAFTFVSDSVKIVFINDNIPLNNMLYSLVHELSHIALGHLTDNPYARDKRLNEMEAEALAYQVLNSTKNMRFLKILIFCITAFCIILGIYCTNGFKTNSNEETTSQTFNTAYTDVSSSDTQNKSEIVYVTPSGAKYHRFDCRYVKNKNCTSLTRAEATLKYAPCSVCKPQNYLLR